MAMMARVWTAVSLVFPARCARVAGSAVTAVEAAWGSTTVTAHNAALQRLIPAGVMPGPSLQVLREFSQDWSRRDMGDAVIDMLTPHAGADGMGVEYAESIVHGQSVSMSEASCTVRHTFLSRIRGVHSTVADTSHVSKQPCGTDGS